MPAIAAQFGLGGDVVITPLVGDVDDHVTYHKGDSIIAPCSDLINCERVLVDAALGYGDRPDTSGKSCVYDDLRNAEEGDGCVCEVSLPMGRSQRGATWVQACGSLYRCQAS